jgi:hypothetical protein
VTRVKGIRYLVRNAAGEELVVPSLAVLHDLYDHGFLGDDDLVRPETGTRWVRAGALPALQGVRERRRDPRKVLLLVLAAAALVAALVLLSRLP